MSSRRSSRWLPIALVIAYVVLAGGYFVLRYAGRWSDSDTAALSAAATGVLREGRLVTSEAYMLGFGYPALTTVLVSVTGITVPQLQLLVYPLAAAGLGLLAFAVYREFTGDLTAAALGVLLLFVQPDFLFVIFRGSHEKLTWSTALLALFLLSRSLAAAQAHRPLSFAACVTLFYLAIYALIASNAFFGSAFILAVAVSLLAGFFIMLWTMGRSDAGRNSRKAVARLGYAAGVAFVIWLLHFFWIYPEAIGFLNALNDRLGTARAVALGYAGAADTFATIRWGWVSSAAYLALAIPTFATAGLSLIAWAARGITYLSERGKLAEEPQQFLGWLLYGGFGLEIAASLVLAPTTGVGNLQLRMLPVLLLLGVPLVTRALVELWRARSLRWLDRPLVVGMSLLLLWMACASLLKATNDPVLSNYWIVWSAPEGQAVSWASQHLRYRSIWLGLDSIRLSSYAVATDAGKDSGDTFSSGHPEVMTRDFLISDIDRSLSPRKLEAIPDVRDTNRVYDNGAAAQYHQRPRTPLQQ
jgi:hypothetical protein